MHMSKHARKAGCLHSHTLELDVPDIDGDVRSLQMDWGAILEVCFFDLAVHAPISLSMFTFARHVSLCRMTSLQHLGMMSTQRLRL